MNPPGAGTDQVSAIPAGAFCRLRIIPVAVIDKGGDAAPITEALLAGGIGGAEIMLRTSAALLRWP